MQDHCGAPAGFEPALPRPEREIHTAVTCGNAAPRWNMGTHRAQEPRRLKARGSLGDRSSHGDVPHQTGPGSSRLRRS